MILFETAGEYKNINRKNNIFNVETSYFDIFLLYFCYYLD